jgi:alkaline phosphatase
MKTQNKRTMRVVAILVITILLITAVFPATLSAAPKKPIAKNIIVMIADGWNQNHVDASSYYQYGAAARQVYNRFPFHFAMSTYMAYDEGVLHGLGSGGNCHVNRRQDIWRRHWRRSR